ncbi:MAG: carbamoyl-phosphate synthase large subunit [Elusimicrobiota bacterium]|nr:carbamoyl-phosphate synthase large subunit [Elusimicrobiota bacterium]
MPKRTDIEKILIVGSGPIVIGQACEFDYSGTQACKALKELGYKTVLLNSNPATIMTDPEMADRTYIEPITVDILEKIIAIEKPQALLPTLGGQTALNLGTQAYELGILDKYNVELIGANYETIKKAENRLDFKQAMEDAGIALPRSGYVSTVEEALQITDTVGYPVIIRPSYTLGGTGGSIAYDSKDLIQKVTYGLQTSPLHEVLIEENVLGWKEIEVEIMRDKKDQIVIVCWMENIDSMGIHTGDSIVVAPAQTLTDEDYKNLRDLSIRAIRAIGLDASGANIQFAMKPNSPPGSSNTVIIEINPRTSRSSALASKATGFPIAKVATKLAVGLTFDEILKEIDTTKQICFESVANYVVIKIPRFTFEKFLEADQKLDTSMKSVGEVMSIGKTFKEALQKAIRGLEIGRYGLGADGLGQVPIVEKLKTRSKNDIEKMAYLELVKYKLRIPNCDRIFNIKYALQLGMTVDEICELSKIDKWFIQEIKEIVELEKQIGLEFGRGEAELLKKAKQYGFSDYQIAYLTRKNEQEVRQLRKEMNILPAYKLVDTCAAKFEAYTPYYYSTYEEEDEAVVPSNQSHTHQSPINQSTTNQSFAHQSTTDPFPAHQSSAHELPSHPSSHATSHQFQSHKIMILGGGPNRIGQGIEFDYCCVHAAFALRELGYETIMVNCNPETVSTDYDTSDKLYFEPLTLEDVLNIVDKEQPEGVIVQFGGQTPLNIVMKLKSAGVNIIGTQPEIIDLTEDRDKFATFISKLNIPIPEWGSAKTPKEGQQIAKNIGYPVIVRPSYVLGGRAMKIVYDDESLLEYIQRATEISLEAPILIDKFLQDATEVDVDAICDGENGNVSIGGIMEHIEEAGIHSGDSACIIPPQDLKPEIIHIIIDYTKKIATNLNVQGLINIQFAVKDATVFVLEVNPRASRTVPFVSKATGLPLAKIATKVIVGMKLNKVLSDYRTIALSHNCTIAPLHHPTIATLLHRHIVPAFSHPTKYVAVKESVFPFMRFSDVDPVLGPEMRSTGEVMGIDTDFGLAFYKAQLAAGSSLPTSGKGVDKGGKIFISVSDRDKEKILPVAKKLKELGFELIATKNTHQYFKQKGILSEKISKIGEAKPDIIDVIKSGEIKLIINTPTGKKASIDGYYIRRNAYLNNIPIVTTVSGAIAAVKSIESQTKNTRIDVRALQECKL